jgi:hypothetical protein
MLAISRSHARFFEHNLPATPNTVGPGTTVTGAGTAHTKGSWTSLIDPTTYDTFGLFLTIAGTATSNTRTDALVDIGIGPSGGGSEQVIIPNMIAGWRGTANAVPPTGLYLPMYIPAGVRVSARAQGLQINKQVQVGIWLHQGFSGMADDLFTQCDAYGINTSLSIGTSHTPGALGALSTFADLGSTLSRDYGAVLLIPQGTLADTSMRNDAYHWWVRADSGGEVVGGWYVAGNSNELVAGPYPGMPLDLNLPSGTQLQVAAECSSASPEAYDVAAYCFC